MAGIDKTYTNSYKEYKEFKDWADSQYLTFFDGLKVCIGDWVWDLEEEDFVDNERAIMNTPTWLDIYLIQNCKSQFVLDRMQSVYSEEDYKKFQAIKLGDRPPDGFEQNRKITIRRHKRTRFPLHSKPYGGYPWWLQSASFNYNTGTKRWVGEQEYYPTNTNTAHPKSLKGLVRHLRKQYLPKGAEFILFGRYVGEEYLIIVT